MLRASLLISSELSGLTLKYMDKGHEAFARPPEPDAHSSAGVPDVDGDLSVSALKLTLSCFEMSHCSALQLISDHTMELTNAIGVAIALRKDENVMCVASTGDAPSKGERLNPKNGLSGQCFRTGEVVRCDDILSDARIHSSVVKSLPFRSVVALPICKLGHVLGLMVVFGAQPHYFQDDDVTTLLKICDIIMEIATTSSDHSIRTHETIIGASDTRDTDNDCFRVARPGPNLSGERARIAKDHSDKDSSSIKTGCNNSVTVGYSPPDQASESRKARHDSSNLMSSSSSSNAPMKVRSTLMGITRKIARLLIHSNYLH